MKEDVRLNKGGNMDSFFNNIDKLVALFVPFGCML